MKLSQLICQADTTYGLGLQLSEKRELQRLLISAGYHTEFSPSKTSQVIDAVLQTTDNLRSRPRRVAVANYSGLKVESAVEHDGCPRCHQPMQQVALVNDRKADYCAACAITLPNRA